MVTFSAACAWLRMEKSGSVAAPASRLRRPVVGLAVVIPENSLMVRAFSTLVR